MGIRGLGRSGACGLLALAVVACGGRAGPDVRAEASAAVSLAARSSSLALRTPAGIPTLSVALSATEGVEIATHAEAGAVVPPGIVTNVGTGTVALGAHALGGTVVASGEITLAAQAKVLGDLRGSSVQLGPKAVVLGTTTAPAPPLIPQVTTFPVVFPAGVVSDVAIGAHEDATLAPGRYGTVAVGPHGTLRLSAGTYYFEKWTEGAQANVVVGSANAPITVIVQSEISLQGNWTMPPGFADIAVIGAGGAPVDIQDTFRGVVLAPQSIVTLQEHAVLHGAVFGRVVRLKAHASLVPGHTGFVASVLHPPSVGIEACARAIVPRADLPEAQKQLEYQREIARYCSLAGGEPPQTACTVDLVARANVDYYAAALRIVADQISPAEYLAFVRDRTRKRYAAEDNPAYGALLCSGADADDDWIPDALDTCPGTPPNTPTTDDGCADPVLPLAPTREEVQADLAKRGLMFHPGCAGSLMIPRLPAGGFYYPSNLAAGGYILAGRIGSPPPGCPVWYFFDIAEYEAGVAVRRYSVSFQDKEELTALVGSSLPVPPGFVQFQALPTDAGTRGELGNLPARIQANHRSLLYRVKAMNGAGHQSDWSEWKKTTHQDCLSLGFTCGGTP